jgi:hypothetical protein
VINPAAYQPLAGQFWSKYNHVSSSLGHTTMVSSGIGEGTHLYVSSTIIACKLYSLKLCISM